MTTRTHPEYREISQAIATGALDSRLAEIEKLCKLRMTEIRKSRTIADYPIGATVVINDYCGTAYLRGHRATVTSRGRTKLTIVLEKPVGRFVRVENGVARSVEIKVPTSIVDLVD